MAAIAYGILQLVVDPYIITYPPDYLRIIFLGLAPLGFPGFFPKKKYGLIKGYIAGILGEVFLYLFIGYDFFRKLCFRLSYVGACIFFDIQRVIYRAGSVADANDSFSSPGKKRAGEGKRNGDRGIGKERLGGWNETFSDRRERFLRKPDREGLSGHMPGAWRNGYP